MQSREFEHPRRPHIVGLNFFGSVVFVVVVVDDCVVVVVGVML